jgi:hypothetical protein
MNLNFILLDIPDVVADVAEESTGIDWQNVALPVALLAAAVIALFTTLKMFDKRNQKQQAKLVETIEAKHLIIVTNIKEENATIIANLKEEYTVIIEELEKRIEEKDVEYKESIDELEKRIEKKEVENQVLISKFTEHIGKRDAELLEVIKNVSLIMKDNSETMKVFATRLDGLHFALKKD